TADCFDEPGQLFRAGILAGEQPQEAVCRLVGQEASPAGVVEAPEVEAAPGGGQVGAVGQGLGAVGLVGTGQSLEGVGEEAFIEVTALVEGDEGVSGGGPRVVESPVQLGIRDGGDVEVAQLGEEAVAFVRPWRATGCHPSPGGAPGALRGDAGGLLRARPAAGVDTGPAAEVQAVEDLLACLGVLTRVQGVDLGAVAAGGQGV